MTRQLVPPRVWTQLVGADVEAWHEAEANVLVWLERGRLGRYPADVRVILRPLDGVPADWKAPVAGLYVL